MTSTPIVEGASEAVQVGAAAVVLPCAELGPNLEFFEALGFRLEMITPADDPCVALLSGFGLRLRLERGIDAPPAELRLTTPAGTAPKELQAPNGARVRLLAETPLEVPPLQASFVLSRATDAAWIEGRAGMRYRDLIPDRFGGRYIASHIQITDGGPVPDYVHHHQIRFQLIYVQRGWVEVVYESHGEPIVMREGDCVLQPPHIRHRVLSSSAGLEVVEVACPAAHPTFREHDLTLPTAAFEKDFAGQRFIHHIASDANWVATESNEERDTGLGQASGGLVDVRAFRQLRSAPPVSHDAELCLFFVSVGHTDFACAGQGRFSLTVGDAVAIPAGMPWQWLEPSSDLEVLRIASPADIRLHPHPQLELV